jgi:hypothetical protein
MSPAAAAARRGPSRRSGTAVAPRRFYRRGLPSVGTAGVPFLGGGGHAHERSPGIGRWVIDLDL